MNDEERLAADFSGTGLTTGPHLIAYHRTALRSAGILSAKELEHCANRQPISIAGCVIARQRPGTAKGFVFLSLEDETGIANIVIQPDVFEANRLVVTRSRILRIDGQLQLQDGVIHVKAKEILPLDISNAEVRSHDFY
jgi:error-prone DNA polymerase